MPWTFTNITTVDADFGAGLTKSGKVTIPAGQIGNERPIIVVDEVWRSPELQVTVQSSHNDPRMGVTQYSLRNVSRSEPAPTLFQVPSDYTVKEPPAPPKPVQVP